MQLAKTFANVTVNEAHKIPQVSEFLNPKLNSKTILSAFSQNAFVTISPTTQTRDRDLGTFQSMENHGKSQESQLSACSYKYDPPFASAKMHPFPPDETGSLDLDRSDLEKIVTANNT